MLGAAGEQQAVTAQYDRLGQDLLDLYARDFVAAWRRTLWPAAVQAAHRGQAQIHRAERGRRRRPRRSSNFWNRSVTRRRSRASGRVLASRRRPLAPAPRRQASRRRPCCGSRAKRPAPPSRRPSRRSTCWSKATRARRPIDAIVANLNEINQSLTTLATNPAHAGAGQRRNCSSRSRACGPTRRGCRRRSPTCFCGRPARSRAIVTSSSHAQLRRALGDQVTGVCQQIAPDRYPFVRGAGREVPLAEFGRLFAPNGVMDRFFTQNLAPLVDTSRREWT